MRKACSGNALYCQNGVIVNGVWIFDEVVRRTSPIISKSSLVVTFAAPYLALRWAGSKRVASTCLDDLRN